MVAPRWVRTRTQPIAIEDVLAYLLAAARLPLRGAEVVEIGGADAGHVPRLMREYAGSRARRLIVPVPVSDAADLLTSGFGLVTPVYARVGRKLVESLRQRHGRGEPACSGALPVRPMGYR